MCDERSLTGRNHANHDQNERYVPTDPASELHLLLWTLGVPDAARRAIVQRAVALFTREREPACTASSQT